MQLTELKNISIAAGAEGLRREVSWTNTIESPDLAEFAHPNELIFMTGIQIRNDEELLLQLVKKLYAVNTAGLLINLGPYISIIPERIIKFANANVYPVFSMPWNIRIADTAHVICEYIIKSSEVNASRIKPEINDIFRRLTLGASDAAAEIDILKRNGFTDNQNYCVLVCSLANEAKEKEAEIIRQVINHQLSFLGRPPVSFYVANTLLFVLITRLNPGSFMNDMDSIMTSAARKIEMQIDELNFCVGMGFFYDHPEKLHQSYIEALTAIKASKFKTIAEKRYFNFAESGVFRLFTNFKDQAELKIFSNMILDKLKQYDRINSSNNLEFLRYYLEEDGSVSRIVKRLYMHRNTVMYRVKKIEDILKCNLSSSLDKTNLMVAIIIEDILKPLPDNL